MGKFAISLLFFTTSVIMGVGANLSLEYGDYESEEYFSLSHFYRLDSENMKKSFESVLSKKFLKSYLTRILSARKTVIQNYDDVKKKVKNLTDLSIKIKENGSRWLRLKRFGLMKKVNWFSLRKITKKSYYNILYKIEDDLALESDQVQFSQIAKWLMAITETDEEMLRYIGIDQYNCSTILCDKIVLRNLYKIGRRIDRMTTAFLRGKIAVENNSKACISEDSKKKKKISSAAKNVEKWNKMFRKAINDLINALKSSKFYDHISIRRASHLGDLQNLQIIMKLEKFVQDEISFCSIIL